MWKDKGLGCRYKCSRVLWLQQQSRGHELLFVLVVNSLVAPYSQTEKLAISRIAHSLRHYRHVGMQSLVSERPDFRLLWLLLRRSLLLGSGAHVLSR